MSQFRLAVTAAGKEALAASAAGGALRFVRMELGDGAYSGDPAGVEEMISPKMQLEIVKTAREGNRVSVHASLPYSSIEAPFYWRELGVFAEDASGNEVLAVYGNAGDKADYLSAQDGVAEEREIVLRILVEENAVVTELSGVLFATTAQLEAHAGSAGHVCALSHQKSGTVHQLTGLSGASGTVSAVFTAAASYASGDTVTVDGESYTIQLSNGETAEENLFVAGAAVPVVLDTAGKKVNFKPAGGQKLPAETLAIVKIFTANDTFTVPQTGNYRITVIGPGGKGGYAQSANKSGFGGGAGGAAQIIQKLSRGESFPVTVNESNSSFGSLVSATAGKSGGKWDEAPGTGGTGSGGTSYQGGSGKSKSSEIQTQGTDGGCYTSEQAAVMAALSETGGKGGDQEDGKIPCTVSKAGFAPFGCGGGGGGYQYSGTAGDWSGRRDGGEGFGGAVIIELVL